MDGCAFALKLSSSAGNCPKSFKNRLFRPFFSWNGASSSSNGQIKPFFDLDPSHIKVDLKQIKVDLTFFDLDLRQIKVALRRINLGLTFFKVNPRRIKAGSRQIKVDLEQIKVGLTFFDLDLRQIKVTRWLFLPTPRGSWFSHRRRNEKLFQLLALNSAPKHLQFLPQLFQRQTDDVAVGAGNSRDN